jgi:hypothetical protein
VYPLIFLANQTQKSAGKNRRMCTEKASGAEKITNGKGQLIDENL